MAYIFLNERILQPFLKYETLNFARHLSADFFRLFLYNFGVLNSNLSDNILSLVSFTSKKATKNGLKCALYFICKLTQTHNFRFLHDLELINLSVMLLDKMTFI